MFELEFQFHFAEYPSYGLPSKKPVSIVFLWGGAYKKLDESIFPAPGWFLSVALLPNRLDDKEYLSRKADAAFEKITTLMDAVLGDRAKGRFCLSWASDSDQPSENYERCTEFRFLSQHAVQEYEETDWEDLPKGFWKEASRPTKEYVRNAVSACAAQRPAPVMARDWRGYRKLGRKQGANDVKSEQLLILKQAAKQSLRSMEEIIECQRKLRGKEWAAELLTYDLYHRDEFLAFLLELHHIQEKGRTEISRGFSAFLLTQALDWREQEWENDDEPVPPGVNCYTKRR